MTISPFLRETLPLGTLGADKIHASKVTDAVKEDNKHVAKGFKIQNLNKTVDSILASASRLEKEIEVETKYWEQVLAVSENGWAVCRLPNEKQTLGVRFGFSEGAVSSLQSCFSLPSVLFCANHQQHQRHSEIAV
jgi:mediator of RNA polymerase II transcription subunit 17